MAKRKKHRKAVSRSDPRPDGAPVEGQAPMASGAPSTSRFRAVAATLSQSPEIDLLPIRRCWPHLLVVFSILLSVYFSTTPRTVALEDDGEFVTAAYFVGIAHPPGYPLYSFLGGLLVRL